MTDLVELSNLIHEANAEIDAEIRTWLDDILDTLAARAKGAPWATRYTVGTWYVVPADPDTPADYDVIPVMQATGPSRHEHQHNAEVTVIARNLLPRTVATVRAILHQCDEWPHEALLCASKSGPCVCLVGLRRRRLIRHLAALFDQIPGYRQEWRPHP